MSTEAYAKAALNVVAEPGLRLPDAREVLGVSADSYCRAGQIPETGGRPWLRDAWYLTEQIAVPKGSEFSVAAEKCLSNLLDRLSALRAAEKLHASGLARNSSISLYGFCRNLRDANISYQPAILSILANLGLPLDEDFYQLPDEE